MKENIRRLILFAAIVGIGSVLIFANLPLIYLLPLIIVVGFVLLLVLGAITIAEIKAALAKLSFKNLRQNPLLKRLDSIEIGGKKAVAPKEPADKKPVKSPERKSPEKGGGISKHFSLLASSVLSLKSILTERKKPAKKPDEINKLLDRTISEKVSRGSALESAATVPAAAGGGGGAGTAPPPAEMPDEADPFLSLSGEELETGLLDGLDEMDLDASPSVIAPSADAPAAAGAADSSADLSMPDLDMPSLPDSDTNAEADAILKAHAGPGPEEFENLEGGDAIDENLGDLDSINLDDVDLGDDSPAEPSPALAVPAAAPSSGTGNLIPATPMTPAAEPGADTDQSDISSFAAGGGPGSDDDMLSSLASDIKQVKKEKDVSLLRELKDFQAPATDIEKELQEMADHLNEAGKGIKKKKSSPQGMK
ncbi:MAG TPA: hypothetical protein PLM60_10445 [Methanoregulaceae archaeon]|nr:hypothetical protein [Methanoregulaceae archaeon]